MYTYFVKKMHIYIVTESCLVGVCPRLTPARNDYYYTPYLCNVLNMIFVNL